MACHRNATHNEQLTKSIRTMNAGWIHMQRVGHSTQATLLPRSSAVLDRLLLARIRGIGMHSGLPKPSHQAR